VVGRADAEPEKGKTNHEDEPGEFVLRSLQTWDAFTSSVPRSGVRWTAGPVREVIRAEQTGWARLSAQAHS